MTYDERRTTVERDTGDPAPVADPYYRGGRPTQQVVEQHDRTAYRPSGATLAARTVIAIFGIIQALILIRILLLVLDAQRSNALVSGILNASQLFVAPFEGMFRTNALQAGGSILDIAAITALIAATIVELVILAIVRIPRRTEDV